ncbi:MAG: DNA polymerase IV [Thermodesulfobacteriota bacterium]
MVRKIIHIDMDAFYAAVEQKDNPALKGRPVIVGGDPQKRGVVSAASYEARAYGVHSAMPISQAQKLCPQGIFLPVRMPRYQEVSRQIFKIFEEYTPLIEPLSLDEAFLDITQCELLFGPALQIAKDIKKRIYETTGLTSSAGLAPNKFLAKIASDLKKPDGLVEVRPEVVKEFLSPLPISKLWGVGKVTTDILRSLGIWQVGQLANFPPEILERKLGKFGRQLIALARGEDERPVMPHSAVKSISQEETFTPELFEQREMERVLLFQAEQVSFELRQQGLKGKTVQIKVRYPDFRLITRSLTLASPTDQGWAIYQVACQLLARTDVLQKKARLLGVGITNLQRADYPQQLSLFVHEEKKSRAASVIDRICKKFGPQAIQRATLLEKK